LTFEALDEIALSNTFTLATSPDLRAGTREPRSLNTEDMPAYMPRNSLSTFAEEGRGKLFKLVDSFVNIGSTLLNWSAKTSMAACSETGFDEDVLVGGERAAMFFVAC
jgi:hypothetical protein